MGWFSKKTVRADSAAVLAALDRSQALIEFDLDGTVLTANQNFLKAMGYELSEIQGKRHSMFIEPAYRDSADYQEFWAKLRRGEFQRAQFKRIGKGGREVWIEASYNPVFGANGKPVKVVKFATDVTAAKTDYADLLGKVTAISKSQAVIEFELDGTVITANQNFLTAMGYDLSEIKGKNHSMFVPPAFRNSQEYADFWAKLRHGDYQQAQYKRIGKGGREVWIDGSYNPILDLNGKPVKVVKFATDITRQITLLDDLKKLIDVNFSEIDVAIEQSNSQSDRAASAAGETTSNVQTLAASAEELAASINEISDSMTKSQAATGNAVDQVLSAGQAAKRLSEAAAAMGGIVGLIQNIAGQINLLALNATIESARAGDAGKGFAANEVKTWPTRPPKPPSRSPGNIENVQSISEKPSGPWMASAVLSIPSAYMSRPPPRRSRSKAAVTRDMSLNMQNSSTAVDTISRNIAGIAASIQQAGAAVTKTKDAPHVLAR